VPGTNTESELKPQLDLNKIQPDDFDRAGFASSTQPENTKATREKALAGSAPGSEYWLP
jgi:hypothetical protein